MASWSQERRARYQEQRKIWAAEEAERKGKQMEQMAIDGERMLQERDEQLADHKIMLDETYEALADALDTLTSIYYSASYAESLICHFVSERRKQIYPDAINHRYKKTPIPRTLRIAVFERDAYRCQRCGSWKQLAVDHRKPERLGGLAAMDNLQTLCRTCNLSKGTKYDGPVQ